MMWAKNRFAWSNNINSWLQLWKSFNTRSGSRKIGKMTVVSFLMYQLCLMIKLYMCVHKFLQHFLYFVPTFLHVSPHLFCLKYVRSCSLIICFFFACVFDADRAIRSLYSKHTIYSLYSCTLFPSPVIQIACAEPRSQVQRPSLEDEQVHVETWRFYIITR